MKIEIKDFNNAKDNTLEFDYYIENIEDVKLKDKVHVMGKAIKDKDGKIKVSGNYNLIAIENCVRCLKELEIELAGEFHGEFLDKMEYEKYLKSLNDECEIKTTDVYDEIIDGKIDLDSLVREYIILDLPPYPECLVECEDETYLNKYKDDGIDPRWQQLLQIKN